MADLGITVDGRPLGDVPAAGVGAVAGVMPDAQDHRDHGEIDLAAVDGADRSSRKLGDLLQGSAGLFAAFAGHGFGLSEQPHIPLPPTGPSAIFWGIGRNGNTRRITRGGHSGQNRDGAIKAFRANADCAWWCFCRPR